MRKTKGEAKLCLDSILSVTGSMKRQSLQCADFQTEFHPQHDKPSQFIEIHRFSFGFPLGKLRLTYVVLLFRHVLLHLLNNPTHFLRIFSDTTNLFLIKIWCYLFAQEYLTNNIPKIGWPSSVLCNKKQQDDIYENSAGTEVSRTESIAQYPVLLLIHWWK